MACTSRSPQIMSGFHGLNPSPSFITRNALREPTPRGIGAGLNMRGRAVPEFSCVGYKVVSLVLLFSYLKQVAKPLLKRPTGVAFPFRKPRVAEKRPFPHDGPCTCHIYSSISIWAWNVEIETINLHLWLHGGVPGLGNHQPVLGHESPTTLMSKDFRIEAMSIHTSTIITYFFFPEVREYGPLQILHNSKGSIF